MQDPDSIESPRPGAAERAPGLSPVRTFLLLATVAMLVPLGIFATRDEAAPAESPGAARSPDFSLTNAEAIAEFERLNDQLIAAYRTRDITLAEQVFTSDSPMLQRVRREIHSLIRSNVVSLTRFEEVSTRVLATGLSAVTVERVEVVHPQFRTEAGEDASRSAGPQRERVEWQMRNEQGRWLLHDATVVGRQILRAS